jgi:repressor LexA
MHNLLTPKQQHVLEYLEATIRERGASPSLREAAAELGVSHAATAQYLKALEAKGYIRREGRYGRRLVVLRGAAATGRGGAERRRFREAPIVGRVAAGRPLYAQEKWEGLVLVDPDHCRGEQLFSLRVEGDSMREAGILPGDLVICEARTSVENGVIVVALIGEEATVKRFFRHPERIELRPENPGHAVQFYGFDEVLIQGLVVGLQRWYCG